MSDLPVEIKCKNCNYNFSGNFCNNCGQKASVNRITVKETFTDFISATFSLEGVFTKTLKGLATNPGVLLQEFISGKRKTYYKPVSFFILTTVLYLIVRSFVDFDPMKTLSEFKVKKNKELFKNLVDAGKFMFTNYNHILLFLVFGYSTAFKLFFRKKFYFAEYLAISFYLIGVYNLMNLLGLFFSNSLGLPKVTFIILFGIYTIWAMTSFFGKRSLISILKVFCSIIIGHFLFIILGYSISFLIVYIKYLWI